MFREAGRCSVSGSFGAVLAVKSAGGDPRSGCGVCAAGWRRVGRWVGWYTLEAPSGAVSQMASQKAPFAGAHVHTLTGPSALTPVARTFTCGRPPAPSGVSRPAQETLLHPVVEADLAETTSGSAGVFQQAGEVAVSRSLGMCNWPPRPLHVGDVGLARPLQSASSSGLVEVLVEVAGHGEKAADVTGEKAADPRFPSGAGLL